METIPRKALEDIILQLSYPDILKLCQSAKYFQDTVCRAGFDNLWRKLYQRDIDMEAPPNPREEYFRVFSDITEFEETPDDPDKIRHIIQYAIENQYRTLLDSLLKANPDYQRLALESAAYEGYREIVQNILGLANLGLDNLHFEGDTLNNAIFNAGLGNHQEIIDDLLEEGASLTLALQGAAEGGHRELVQRLIDIGPIEMINIDDVIQAAAFGNHPEIINDLLSLGANIRAALLGAVQGGHKNLVISLVNKGLTQGSLDTDDLNDALDLAISEKQLSIAESLIDLGAIKSSST